MRHTNSKINKKKEQHGNYIFCFKLIFILKEYMSNIICVYKITSPAGNTYIGSTINLKRRLNEHKKHSGCRHLHNSIQKYGWDMHIVEIIEYCNDINELRSLESKYKQLFIDENGWEKALFFHIDDRSKYVSPDDFSEKMRKIALENWKKHSSMGFTGKKHKESSNIQRVNTRRINGTLNPSAETKQKISKSNIGKKRSDETKQKISLSKKGKKISDAHRLALSIPRGKQTKIVCPYCKKDGGNAMRRWHFENCKFKN